MNPFAITYNGLTIDYNDPSFTATILDGVEGIPIRVSEDLLTGGHGGNIWAQKYDMRTIALEGTVKGTNIDNYFSKKNELVNAFAINDNNVLEVTMWDGTKRTITAYVIDPPMIPHRNGRITFNNYRVELKCPYPFWGDDTVQSLSVGLRDSVGFPLPAPLAMPLLGSSENILIINNQGKVEAYPTYRISNAVTNPTVTNMTNGQSFTIETTLIDGEYIDVYVDQDGAFIIKNDGSNYRELFIGEIPIMALGNNELRFTAQNYSATALLEVTFTSKYITI